MTAKYIGKVTRLLLIASLLPSAQPVFAAPGDTTWEANVSDSWTDNTNWSDTAPVSPGQRAIFVDTVATDPDLKVGNTISIDGINFAAATKSYIIRNDADMTVGSSEIINGSGFTQDIVNNQLLTLNETIVDPDINITNNDTLVINNDTDVVNEAAITGVGSLVKNGLGLLALPTSSDYTGDTSVNAGTLQIGEDTSTDAVMFSNVSVADQAKLIFDKDGNNFTYSNVISGAGEFEKRGGSILIMTGDNTYTGTTTISAGRLTLGSGSVSGNLATQSIVNNAEFVINTNNDLTLDASVSGTGTLQKSGIGEVTLTQRSDYDGDTSVNAGTLEFGSDISTDAIIPGDVFVASQAKLIFNKDGNNFTYSDVISGGGDFEKKGGSILIMTGDNTYTGTTTISGGRLTLGDGTTSGSLATQSIVNNAEFLINTDDDVTLDAPVSGTGTLTKSGTGVVTLAQRSDYEGDTSVNEGTLEFGSDTSTDAIIPGNVSVVDQAKLIFNRDGNNFTYSDVISGEGDFEKKGDSILIMTNDNTYTGTTTITEGRLTLGDGTTLGSLATDSISIADNAEFLINSNENIVFNTPVTGSGVLRKSGTGALTLPGIDYTGGTSVDQGTLEIGSDTSTDAVIAGNVFVADQAKLIFNKDGGDAVYSDVISGAGSFEKHGNSNLIMTGNNVYQGATVISEGRLTLGSGAASAGLATQSIINNSEFVIDSDNDIVINALVSGTGSVQKSGTGKATLAGVSNYTGGTSVNQGTLEIGSDTSTDAVIPGNVSVSDQAKLIFNKDGNNLTYSDVISGAGEFEKTGGSILIMTGDNTYTGTTTISGGRLTVGDGVNESGSLASQNIINNGELNFKRPDMVTYNGEISGSGAVTAGTGGLTLNGDNTYTGQTTVGEDSILVVGDTTGSGAKVTGDVLVNNNATLGGHGTIEGDVISTGILSPGASIGTLTVGSYTQTAGTYNVEINAAGDSDQLVVTTGDVNISGVDLVIDTSAGFLPGASYNFISTTGTGNIVSVDFANVTGTPATLSEGFLLAEITQTTDGIVLVPSFNSTAFNDLAITPNEHAVSNYIVATGGTPAVQSLVLSLSTTDSEAFDDTMDQLSAATYANQVMQLAQTGSWLTHQMADRIDVYPACKGFTDYKSAAKWPDNCREQRSFWILPYGSSASLDSGTVSGLDTSMGGLSAGYEGSIIGGARGGVAISGSYFSSDAEVQENASDNGMLYQLGFYGSYPVNHWLFGASIDAGITSNVDASRNINDGNAIVTTDGSYNATLFAEQLRASYDFVLKRAHLRPFVAVIAQQANSDSFTETGAADFALTVQDLSYNSVKSELGLSGDVPVGALRLLGSVAWQHEFSDNEGSFNASFAALNDPDTFAISGAEVGSDSALVKLGAVIMQKGRMNLTALYEGKFADSYSENGAKLQLGIDLD